MITTFRAAAIARVVERPVLTVGRRKPDWMSVSIQVGEGDDALHGIVAYTGGAASKMARLLKPGMLIYCRGGGKMRTWERGGRKYHALHISSNHIVTLDENTPTHLAPVARHMGLWDTHGWEEIFLPAQGQRA